MFKSLKSLWKKLFPPKVSTRTQPKVSIGDKVGNVTITTQSQLDKHTDFKVGESYRIGEAIVTLRASKAEVAKVIAFYDKKRAAKEAKLRERAIDIMMMPPAELHKLKVQEWLEKRKASQSRIRAIMGEFTGKRYIAPGEDVPAGSMTLRFKQIMKKAKHTEEIKEVVGVGKDV